MDETEYEHEEDLLEEFNEEPEQYVYHSYGIPRLTNRNTYEIGVDWVYPAIGAMGKGYLDCPSRLAAEEILKHFRTSVSPLSNRDIMKIYDKYSRVSIV